MATVRLGRPTFLRDTALSVGLGALGGLPLALVAAAVGFPEWTETLWSLLVVFACFYPAGLLLRLLLHLGYAYVERGATTPPMYPRSAYLRYSLPVLRCAAGSAGAALVLGAALLLGGRDLSA